MVGWILLTNVVILICCKPFLVNEELDKPSEYSHTIMDPAYLEFLDFKFGGSDDKTPWKDLCTIGVISAAVCLVIYQMMLTSRNEKEIKAILNKCEYNHATVKDVSQFYEETEQLFSSLEVHVKNVKCRFKGAEKSMSNAKDYNTQKDDVKYLKESWSSEYSPLRRLNVTITDKPVCDLEVKVQLTMAKGIIDRELRKIEEYMQEDELAIEEVGRDVRILKNYFGK